MWRWELPFYPAKDPLSIFPTSDQSPPFLCILFPITCQSPPPPSDELSRGQDAQTIGQNVMGCGKRRAMPGHLTWRPKGPKTALRTVGGHMCFSYFVQWKMLVHTGPPFCSLLGGKCFVYRRRGLPSRVRHVFSFDGHPHRGGEINSHLQTREWACCFQGRKRECMFVLR